VQFGLYISPVGFVSAVVPEQYRLVSFLNPMAGIIDGFRWSVLGGQHTLDLIGVLLSVAVTVLFAVTGIWFFRKTEREFADVI
jgi:lipopolysaccharide transport system permease protein